jgi:hypothetical protein
MKPSLAAAALSSPKAQLRGLVLMVQLQQGFTTIGMGDDDHLHRKNRWPLMSSLGQKQTSEHA